MEQDDEIINRVAASTLLLFNLEDLYPKEELAEIDIKSLLFQGMILREKDLRDYIRNTDWSQFQHKHVSVHCSADAVIPTWAYMLVGIALQPYASTVVYGPQPVLISTLYKQALDKIDWERYRDQKVVIKGCGDLPVPESAYVEAASRLRPIVASMMFGEPCSTVPLYKKPK